MLDKIAVLIDFDGTITKTDVGHAFVKKYAKHPEWVEAQQEWLKGSIGSAECYKRQYANMGKTLEELRTEIDQMEIDDYFLEFVDFVATNDAMSIEVVSDGFDYYIEPILSRYKLDIDFHANKIKHREGIFTPEFPHKHHSCSRCANCKVAWVQKQLQSGRRVVYIGDGFPDLYAAAISDVIFAKDKLLKRCDEQGINDYIPYTTFADVLAHFRQGSFDYRFKDVSDRQCQFMMK